MVQKMYKLEIMGGLTEEEAEHDTVEGLSYCGGRCIT